MSLDIESQKKVRKIKAKWKIDSWEDFDAMEEEITKERLIGKEPTIKGKVRITAGKVKNFMVDIPRNTRPLTDRVKVSVFDILSSDIHKKSILDLYAGSGSFGLEALSRGAASVTFVEAAKRAIFIINENIRKTGFLTQTEVVKSKVEEYLAKDERKNEEFDIIFMDPPYKIFNTKHLFRIENLLNQAKSMLPGLKEGSKNKFKGAIVLKHPRRYPIEKLKTPNLKKIETYQFGLNAISIYIVSIDISKE